MMKQPKLNMRQSKLTVKYLEELALYTKVVEVTMEISRNQGGINTDGRGVRAMKVFTRQTLLAISLRRLLPEPKPGQTKEDNFWDLCSIASLTRNIMEGYLALHFFGLEKISESEAELRFFILQLHRNTEWYHIHKLTNPKDPALVEFENGLPQQESRIKTHSFINALPKHQKDRALKGSDIYKTKADFEKELSVCKDLRKDFRLLSNVVHPVPISIERTDDKRGRGLGNELDVNYCLMFMMLARKYLAASTIGIVDHFPNELGKKFKNKIETIRDRTQKGFI